MPDVFSYMLSELKAMLEPPKKLLHTMHTLTPMHTALLHVAPSKAC